MYPKQLTIVIQSQHSYYEYLTESFRTIYLSQSQRERLLNERIIEWINDPDSLSTADSLHLEISRKTDIDAIIKEAEKYIRKVLESSY